MKQIEHDPNEDRKFPDYGEKKWAQEKHDGDPRPSDLFWFFAPIVVVAVAMFLWRGY